MTTQKKKKVFDVTKPGASPPLDTSRPIITPRRTLLRPPSDDEQSDAGDDQSHMSAPHKVTIQPLRPTDTDGSESVEDAAQVPTSGGDVSATDKIVEDKRNAIEPSAEEHVAPEENSEGEQQADVTSQKIDDASSATDTKQKEADKKAANDQAMRDEAIRKLVESKKYHVKIATPQNRHIKRLVWTVVLIVILLVAVYVGLSKFGIVHIGIAP